MKVILWCGIYLALTVSNPATSAAIQAKNAAAGKKPAACPHSPAAIANMVAGLSTVRPACIERKRLASPVDRTTLKKQIKVKLKKAVDKAWKLMQAKEKDAKRRRQENEISNKKLQGKSPASKKPGNSKKRNRTRPVRHADFLLRSHLKNVSEAQLVDAEEADEDKGAQGNLNCKRHCSWDCDGFRCFRKCVCNRTK